MNNRMRSMRMGLVPLAGVVIVLGGWLAGPVARADEEGHEGAQEMKVLAQRVAAAKLTLADAIQAAEKATGGTAIEAEYELEGDGLEIEINVLVGDKVKEVEFDAMTGKVMKGDEKEGHEDEGKDEDKDDDDHDGGHEDND